MHKLQKCVDVENFEQRGRSLLVVVSTPPTKDYENFTRQVNEYNMKEPFNFNIPTLFNQKYNKVNGMHLIQLQSKQIPMVNGSYSFDCFVFFFLFQFVTIYAAYLYDSVKLYAWALDKLLQEDQRQLTDTVIHEIASNGTRIIETIIKNRTYDSMETFPWRMI